MIRTIILYLYYLKYKLTHPKIILKGFGVIFSFRGSSIHIGNGSSIYSSFTSNMIGLYQRNIIVARYGGRIIIGEGCGISGSTIYAMDSITLGNNVLIGGNCKIIDNDFHPIDIEHRRAGLDEQYAQRAPIRIGNDCFIGANSIILKGTVLGNNVVVGAGSVVHGHFPDNCIIAGNPAKIIRKI